MNIHGFITLTLLDYPEHLAASVFLGSCNLRCPFCQNGNLVLSPENEPSISEEEVLAFLKKRSGILEGVCISGGEPTLYRELPDFISKIKALGYLVKLDTIPISPQVKDKRYFARSEARNFVFFMKTIFLIILPWTSKRNRNNMQKFPGCSRMLQAHRNFCKISIFQKNILCPAA